MSNSSVTRSAVPYGPLPLQLRVRYGERYSRTAALLWPVLLLPHLVALVGLSIVGAACWLASVVSILVTGVYPRPLFDLLVGLGRWSLRVTAYALQLTDSYPPFSLVEREDDAVKIDVTYPPGGRVSRWRPLFAWAMLGPALIVVLVRYALVGWHELVAFASGQLPRDDAERVVETLEQHARVNAYAFCLTSRYPF